MNSVDDVRAQYKLYTKYDYDYCDKITLANSTQTHRYRAQWTQWRRINSEFHVRQIVLDVIAIYFISFNYMLLFMYGGVRVDSEMDLGQMSSRFPPFQWISKFIMISVIYNKINCSQYGLRHITQTHKHYSMFEMQIRESTDGLRLRNIFRMGVFSEQQLQWQMREYPISLDASNIDGRILRTENRIMCIRWIGRKQLDMCLFLSRFFFVLLCDYDRLARTAPTPTNDTFILILNAILRLRVRVLVNEGNNEWFRNIISTFYPQMNIQLSVKIKQ